MRIVSETSGTISNTPTFELQGSQKKKRKGKGMRKFLNRLQLKISPTLKRKVNQIQEVQSVPYRINPRRNMPRHIRIKLTKTKHKERILKATREKQQIIYKGNPICLTADLSVETPQVRRERQDTFKVLKGKNLQLRLMYLARISFKTHGEIKSFSYSAEIQEKKKGLQNQPQTIKKMAIGTYKSIITLKENGLNVPTKRHKLAE